MSFEIAFVSREVYPFGGGGIAAVVTATARLLSRLADVTIITTEYYEERYRELVAAGDPRLPEGVRISFVPEPRSEEMDGFYTPMHVWSAHVYEHLKRLYPSGGPDLVEFPDYCGEGLVTVQARRSLDRALRHAKVLVRVHTSLEICSVLDGYVDAGFPTAVTADTERLVLRNADRLLWPGGDVLESYQRFYGARNLAPAVRIPTAFALHEERKPRLERHVDDDKLRLLYFGRLERRKGVQDLLRAATSLPGADFELTVAGADTDTAPLGVSMRAQLELMAAGDTRIRFVDHADRLELEELIASHDVSVMPSVWECWPTVALESFEVNRPVVATPTGGFVEMVRPGVSGWLTRHGNALELAMTLGWLLEKKEMVRSAIESRGPRSMLDILANEEAILAGYEKLARSGPRRQASRAAPPQALVSVVVPYFRLEDIVEDTLRSVFGQTYLPLEVIVVNDGSLRPEDEVLAELASRYPIQILTQRNSGLGAARNAGVAQSRGPYVFPLDADDMVEPEFVERCVAVLEAEPAVAYVTSWSTYVDERNEPIGGGYRPIGNSAASLERQNVAGSAAAVLRRRVFDLGFAYSQDLIAYEDWQLYRELACAGMYGHVIPEPLIRYRVRSDSMLREAGVPNHERLRGEMEAHLRERQVEWESKNV